MTGRDAVDRAVLDWMVEQERHPAYLPEILAVTSSTRQRPRWTFPGWWLPARGSLPDRRVRIAIVVALLLAALVGVILAVGSLRHDVPFLRQNGAIAFVMNDETLRHDRADIYLVGSDGAPLPFIGFEGDGIEQSCPAFAPDGSLLAYGERPEGEVTDPSVLNTGPTEATLVIVSVDAAAVPAERRRIPVGVTDRVPCPKWSFDGRLVAFQAGDELWIADVDGQITKLGVVERGCCGHPELSWMFDGSAIVVAETRDSAGAIWLIPIDGTPRRLLARAAKVGNHEETIESIATSPVGPYIAIGGVSMRIEGTTGSSDGTFVRVIASEPGSNVTFDETGPDGSYTDPAWAPDGKRLAYALGDSIIVAFLDGSESVVLQGPWAVDGRDASVSVASSVVWSPDGTRLLFIGYATANAAEIDYAVVSLAVDAPPDLKTLTPWTFNLYNAQGHDISWQSINR